MILYYLTIVGTGYTEHIALYSLYRPNLCYHQTSIIIAKIWYILE